MQVFAKMAKTNHLILFLILAVQTIDVTTCFEKSTKKHGIPEGLHDVADYMIDIMKQGFFSRTEEYIKCKNNSKKYNDPCSEAKGTHACLQKVLGHLIDDMRTQGIITSIVSKVIDKISGGKNVHVSELDPLNEELDRWSSTLDAKFDRAVKPIWREILLYLTKESGNDLIENPGLQYDVVKLEIANLLNAELNAPRNALFLTISANDAIASLNIKIHCKPIKKKKPRKKKPTKKKKPKKKKPKKKKKPTPDSCTGILPQTLDYDYNLYGNLCSPNTFPPLPGAYTCPSPCYYFNPDATIVTISNSNCNCGTTGFKCPSTNHIHWQCVTDVYYRSCTASNSCG